jgi:hypothetical protein
MLDVFAERALTAGAQVAEVGLWHRAAPSRSGWPVPVCHRAWQIVARAAPAFELAQHCCV